jgi:hypothetical protein
MGVPGGKQREDMGCGDDAGEGILRQGQWVSHVFHSAVAALCPAFYA